VITVPRVEGETGERRSRRASNKENEGRKEFCLNPFPAVLLPHTASDSLLKSFV
jgi:hypothetical protein